MSCKEVDRIELQVAFVDVCGTLVDLNTLTEFVCFVHNYYKSKFFFRSKFLIALKFNRLGLLGGKQLREIAVQSLSGFHCELLETIASNFFDKFCWPRLNHELIAHLSRLRQGGFKIVLVSASLDVVVKAFAKSLNFDNVLATKLDFQDGTATGVIQGVFCEQNAKVARIKEWLKANCASNTQILTSAYGNTLDDLAMLEWSQHPHVIWGAKNLKDIAVKRNWPIGVHPAIDGYNPDNIMKHVH